MKRRAAVEPSIGHLKSEHRLERNRLKGVAGNAINVVLAAAAINSLELLGSIFCAAYWASGISFNSSWLLSPRRCHTPRSEIRLFSGSTNPDPHPGYAVHR
jgi:hypothetical protein